MKNDFKQLVDQNLSGLQWDAGRQQQVLNALEPEGGTTMKRKWTMALALVAALVMLASVAVAAVLVTYAPAASAKKLAVQAMYDTYGFDRSTLGLFHMEVTGNGQATQVRIFPQEWLPAERIGEYTVTARDGQAEISWTHDDKDAALWASGDPEAPVWGAGQLAAYLALDVTQRDAWLAPYLPAAETAPVQQVAVTPTPVPVAPDDTAQASPFVPDTEPRDGELPAVEAQIIAAAALEDVFGLTGEEIAALDHIATYIVEIGGSRAWSIVFADHETMYYLYLDAATGEILDIGTSTGGNG